MRTNNYVYFTPAGGKVFNDEYAAGKSKIIIDTTFEPQRHINIAGEVEVVPMMLSHFPISQIPGPEPAPAEEMGFEYEYRDQIEMDVRLGDRIYVHYNTIYRQMLDQSMLKVDGRMLFRSAYEMIICAVRYGEIIMIGGWTLIEPDMETWEDIHHPTFYPIKDERGNYMPRPKSEWIITKSAPQAKYLQGYVRHVGKPLIGDLCEVAVGDKILYHKNADWELMIEGKKYFAIRQRHIIAKYL